jgi:hypothetical protein
VSLNGQPYHWRSDVEINATCASHAQTCPTASTADYGLEGRWSCVAKGEWVPGGCPTCDATVACGATQVIGGSTYYCEQLADESSNYRWFTTAQSNSFCSASTGMDHNPGPPTTGHCGSSAVHCHNRSAMQWQFGAQLDINGESCTASSQCQSGNCLGGTCQPAQTCAADGTACTADSACCNAQCIDGVCRPLCNSATSTTNQASFGPYFCSSLNGQPYRWRPLTEVNGACANYAQTCPTASYIDYGAQGRFTCVARGRWVSGGCPTCNASLACGATTTLGGQTYYCLQLGDESSNFRWYLTTESDSFCSPSMGMDHAGTPTPGMCGSSPVHCHNRFAAPHWQFGNPLDINGQGCSANSQCQSGNCSGGTCQCAPTQSCSTLACGQSNGCTTCNPGSGCYSLCTSLSIFSGVNATQVGTNYVRCNAYPCQVRFVANCPSTPLGSRGTANGNPFNVPAWTDAGGQVTTDGSGQYIATYAEPNPRVEQAYTVSVYNRDHSSPTTNNVTITLAP